MNKLFCLAAFVLMAVVPARGQDLSETLGSVGEVYARAYLHPLTSSVGANMNAGLIQFPFRADRSGLNVYLGLRVFGALLPDDDRTFDLQYSEYVAVDVRIGGESVSMRVPATFTLTNAPSIFGRTDVPTATVSVSHDTTLSFLGVRLPVSVDTTFSIEMIGGLVETGISPLVVPEAELGTVLGTRVMVRWLPRIGAGDVGEVGVRGVGIRHSMNQYLPGLPIEITLQSFWQELTADDAVGDNVVSVRTSALGLAVGRAFGPLRIYSGLQLEESTFNVAYDHMVELNGQRETIAVSFSERSEGRLRATIGAGVRAGPSILTFDAGFGDVRVLSVGLGMVID
jgi:hypothetical protein